MVESGNLLPLETLQAGIREQLSPGYVTPVPLQSLLMQENNFCPAFVREQNSQLIFCFQADFPKIIGRRWAWGLSGQECNRPWDKQPHWHSQVAAVSKAAQNCWVQSSPKLLSVSAYLLTEGPPTPNCLIPGLTPQCKPKGLLSLRVLPLHCFFSAFFMNFWANYSSEKFVWTGVHLHAPRGWDETASSKPPCWAASVL